MSYDKPLPLPTKISQEFWKAAKRHELVIQQCLDCGTKIFYPRVYCIKCLSSELKWIRCSGKGRVYSYAVVRAGAPPSFASDVPYIIALIDIEEGVKISSNIVNCRPEDVKCGMGVEAIFEDITDKITLIKFKPITPKDAR